MSLLNRRYFGMLLLSKYMQNAGGFCRQLMSLRRWKEGSESRASKRLQRHFGNATKQCLICATSIALSDVIMRCPVRNARLKSNNNVVPSWTRYFRSGEVHHFKLPYGIRL